VTRAARASAALLALAACLAPAGALGGVSTGDAGRGRALFSARNCNLCHKVEGRGGTLGPSLDRVGTRLAADRLYRLLRDPRSVNPASTMPNPNLSEDEARHLAAYLAALR
jgi:mono/diheme cytochrome c family protein